MLKIFSLTTMLLILSICIYGFFISLAEGRVYGRFSIDNFFLTPKDLAKISELCVTTPVFSYSSADGPRPAIVSLTCDLVGDKILQYLVDNKFNYEPAGINKLYAVYKNKNIEINILKKNEISMHEVTIFEFL